MLSNQHTTTTCQSADLSQGKCCCLFKLIFYCSTSWKTLQALTFSPSQFKPSMLCCKLFFLIVPQLQVWGSVLVWSLRMRPFSHHAGSHNPISVMILIKDGNGTNTGKWADLEERLWKYRTKKRTENQRRK